MRKTFNRTLVQHKKLVASMFRNKIKEMIIPVQKTGKELALVHSEFKCEKCEKEINLQYHHLINRMVKDYTDFWKYSCQRHYWANILILCRQCHGNIEGRQVTSNSTLGTISDEFIRRIKNKYETNKN